MGSPLADERKLAEKLRLPHSAIAALRSKTGTVLWRRLAFTKGRHGQEPVGVWHIDCGSATRFTCGTRVQPRPYMNVTTVMPPRRVCVACVRKRDHWLRALIELEALRND